MSVFHFSWQCHSFFSFWKDGSEPTLGALIEKEEIERGSVSYSVYMYYAGNVGWCMLLLVLIMAVLDTSLSIGTSFWLSAWSEAGLGNEVGGRFFSVDICFKTIVGNNKQMKIIIAWLLITEGCSMLIRRSLVQVPLLSTFLCRPSLYLLNLHSQIPLRFISCHW